MEKFDMYAQLYESQRRFRTACDQLVLLNDKLTTLNKRCDDATSKEHGTFQSALRMRIMILEGMLVAYYNYACLKQNEVLDLRFKLFGEDPTDGETIYGDMFVNDDDIQWCHNLLCKNKQGLHKGRKILRKNAISIVRTYTREFQILMPLQVYKMRSMAKFSRFEANSPI